MRLYPKVEQLLNFCFQFNLLVVNCGRIAAQTNAFWKALEQIKAFTGVKLFKNVIDYLLGAFALDHKLEDIPDDYWLAPVNWSPQTLPKRLQVIKSHSSNYRKGTILPKS